MIQLKHTKFIPVDELQLLANNGKVARYLRDAFPNPYAKADAKWFLEMADTGRFGHTFGIFNNDIFIGVGSIVPQLDIYRINGEIGYWLGEPYWGQGYGTAAIKLLTAYAFEELKLLRVFAGVFAGNMASMKVFEKAGYKSEAIIKSSIIKNGVVLDEHVYSILNPTIKID